MATILTKKSDTASAVPLAADLTNAAGGAELAVNATDKRLFSKTSGGTVVELGTNPTAMAVVGNTTVGGTLGVTGATTLAGVSATTLSASSTVTLSGGTANGVAYLNGSKVITSGSALTFDGTNLGVGAGTVAAKLHVQSSTGNNLYDNTGMALVESTYAGNADQANASIVAKNYYGNLQIMQWQNFGARIGSRVTANGGAGAVAFTVGNDSEAMRLTSTGLGIGTSSPAYKLDVQTSAGRFQVQNYGAGSVLLYSNGALAYNAATTRHEWQVAGSTLMQLESSGNLGLGVTPSAWQTTSYKVLQVNKASLMSEDVTALRLNQNYYIDSAYANRYIGTGYASYYAQVNGVHAWYNAASGTAGATVSFTQALTLDSGGSLLIGDTSAPTNGLTSAALSTKGQGTGGSRRATASSMGVTSSLAQNATANTYSFGGYGGYGLFVAEGGDPNAAWRAAAIIWSTGAALTVLNLGSSNITVGSSGTTVTVQNTSASSQAISWSMLVLG